MQWWPLNKHFQIVNLLCNLMKGFCFVFSYIFIYFLIWVGNMLIMMYGICIQRMASIWVEWMRGKIWSLGTKDFALIPVGDVETLIILSTGTSDYICILKRFFSFEVLTLPQISLQGVFVCMTGSTPLVGSLAPVKVGLAPPCSPTNSGYSCPLTQYLSMVLPES